jgi:hypothetical protein
MIDGVEFQADLVVLKIEGLDINGLVKETPSQHIL